MYLDESIEDDVQVEETEEIISTEPVEEEVVENDDNKGESKDENKYDSSNLDEEELKIDPLEGLGDVPRELKQETDRIQFNDIDKAIGTDNKIEDIAAPKTVERLEQISQERAEARKREEEEDDDEEDKIKIGEKIKLTDLDVHDLEKPKEMNKVPIGLEEIEILT